MTTEISKAEVNLIAPDFTALTIEGSEFTLSQFKGYKILLSLFRNGACALCNLRIHELIKQYPKYEAAGLKIVAVFESSREDMLPYVGKQQPPFPLLADPEARIYQLFGAINDTEKIKELSEKKLLAARFVEAEQAGFKIMHQEGSNFFRVPADFLIREDFTLAKAHVDGGPLFDHISLEEIEAFASGK